MHAAARQHKTTKFRNGETVDMKIISHSLKKCHLDANWEQCLEIPHGVVFGLAPTEMRVVGATSQLPANRVGAGPNLEGNAHRSYFGRGRAGCRR